MSESNGVRGQGFVLGRESYATVSAVEGIRLTSRAVKRTRDMDRQGLSPEQRRRAIIDAHRSDD